MSQNQIVGRYAPSPTGPQHLGNLRTALLAWLQARLEGGRFIVRMEDIDQPRVVPGSAEQILSDLESLGLDWDGEVEYQTDHLERYESALETLRRQNLLYPCFCSRKELQSVSSAPHTDSSIYRGSCRSLTAEEAAQRTQFKTPSLRVQVPSREVQFEDLVCGPQSENLANSVGDFVVRRADGLFAYQLAVVVDDLAQGVTDVVRGADLLTSTARQLYLIEILSGGESHPNYWHVPLLQDETGKRMAKRDLSYSLAQWRSNGHSVEQLIARFAFELNLIETPTALSASDLLAHIGISELRDCLKAASRSTL